MKRCPECRRDYYDDTLLYCLDDGNALLEGPASMDEPQTAILHATEPPSEAATRAQIHMTDQTAVLPKGIGDVPKKSFDKRLLFAPLALVIIVLGGFFGYKHFSASSSKQINSIAVLPFQNKSGDADSEYLSDGLAESLIYRLSQISELKVSPRSSVFRYKGQDVDAEKVGAELGVDAVMSGRMVQRGDNLTISIDLVDVRNKRTLWGEQFERKMSDLLATQREIASAITQKLELKISGDSAKGITKRYTDNNEAYQAYLKGRYYWNRRTAENLNKAIEQFKLATDKDSNFALAYSGLADCYVLLPQYAGIPASEALPQAKTYAERAIALDDQLAEPHASVGLVAQNSWQWAESEREYKRALELNPNYPTVYHWYSGLLRHLGKVDEAAVMMKRAKELDPLSGIIGINISEMYQMENNHRASVENSLKLIELDPNFPLAYAYLGLSYLKLGRNADGIANIEKAVELSNRGANILADLGYGYAVTGKRSEATAILKELEVSYEKKETSGLNLAEVYVGLGDNDKAFEWLEKDFQKKENVADIRYYTAFESLRPDPRFKDLLKRMGLPE